MKIAIVGAHGVGKTTLSTILAEELGLAVIKDIVPEAYHLGFTINEETPIETQIWLTAKQIELERNIVNFVADKCLIDYYIYGDVLLDDTDVKKVLKKLIDRNASYDYILYIPIEFPLVDDGLRSMNPDFQRLIDARYHEYLEDSGLEYHIIKGSIEDRLKTIRKIITPK
ncbi:MAG: ATP-binding protein [Candidatus Gracilibacteria bacterium]|nr:ATP-binding protein [Candidatus Gracilibacteria bacterium]MDD2908648.1 ATP-binding protein [Candidatus Gracilibacteria bacterium]